VILKVILWDYDESIIIDLILIRGGIINMNFSKNTVNQEFDKTINDLITQVNK